MIRAAALALAVAAGGGSALAEDADQGTNAPTPAPVFTLPSVEIIGTTPVQGVGIERDKVPANVQTVPSSRLDRPAKSNLSDILNSGVGSVTVNAVSVNPFQPDISFRGFTASPLLGVPQGIAIYQNGVRVNEPFGDTVQWDAGRVLPHAAQNPAVCPQRYSVRTLHRSLSDRVSQVPAESSADR